LCSIPLGGGEERELAAGLKLPQRLIAQKADLFLLDKFRLLRLHAGFPESVAGSKL